MPHTHTDTLKNSDVIFLQYKSCKFFTTDFQRYGNNDVRTINVKYRKTANRNPRLLLEHLT